jgi:hypothetical protein
MTPERGTPPPPRRRRTLASPVLLVLVLFALARPGAAQSSPDEQSRGLPGILPTCIPNIETLCLNNGRFAVMASYQQTPSGPSFQATAVPLTGDSGYFWFFNEANVELVVKVLDGCFDPFQSYWVFASGLTNVGVTLAVTDTLVGLTKTYENPIGHAFLPIQDTKAFSTCP